MLLKTSSGPLLTSTHTTAIYDEKESAAALSKVRTYPSIARRESTVDNGKRVRDMAAGRRGRR